MTGSFVTRKAAKLPPLIQRLKEVENASLYCVAEPRSAIQGV
jgi:hypothetical protein